MHVAVICRDVHRQLHASRTIPMIVSIAIDGCPILTASSDISRLKKKVSCPSLISSSAAEMTIQRMLSPPGVKASTSVSKSKSGNRDPEPLAPSPVMPRNTVRSVKEQAL